MEIHGSDGGFVLLTPLFGGWSSTTSAPMLYCSCAVEAHRFAGATEPNEPWVRIDMEQLQRFVEEMRVLERDRHGAATLVCPELRLSLFIYDRAGHVRLATDLRAVQTEGTHHVALGFELDPTTLPRILSDLEELLTFPDVSKTSPEVLEP